jgi:hypothetical protein
MELSDLHEFPKNHPPSPYGKPVSVIKVGDGTLPGGLTLRAVGWLEQSGFATGTVPKSCIGALVEALRGCIFSDGYRGYHTCTLCGKFLPEIKWKRRRIRLQGHGHYLVQLGHVVYMAPALLLHYILDHSYCPPDEFLDALLNGRFLTEKDLIIRWRSTGDGKIAESSNVQGRRRTKRQT